MFTLTSLTVSHHPPRNGLTIPKSMMTVTSRTRPSTTAEMLGADVIPTSNIFHLTMRPEKQAINRADSRTSDAALSKETADRRGAGRSVDFFKIGPKDDARIDGCRLGHLVHE